MYRYSAKNAIVGVLYIRWNQSVYVYMCILHSCVCIALCKAYRDNSAALVHTIKSHTKCTHVNTHTPQHASKWLNRPQQGDLSSIPSIGDLDLLTRNSRYLESDVDLDTYIDTDTHTKAMYRDTEVTVGCDYCATERDMVPGNPVYIRMHMYAYMFIYTHIYTYIYIYVCVYIYFARDVRDGEGRGSRIFFT